MARVNVDDPNQPEKRTEVEGKNKKTVVYTTVGDIIELLEDPKIEIDTGLYTDVIDILRKFDYQGVPNLDNAENRKEIAKFISSLGINNTEISKINEIKKEEENLIHETTEDDLGSKVYVEQVRELTREMDTILSKREIEAINSDELRDELYKKFGKTKEVTLFVERVRNNYEKALLKIKDSELVLNTKERLEVAKIVAEEATVAETKMENPGKIEEVIDRSVELLSSKEKGKTKETKKEGSIEKIARDIEAEVIVQKEIDKVTDELVEKIKTSSSKDIGKDEVIKIKEIIKGRVENVVEGKRGTITERKITVTGPKNAETEASLRTVINESVFKGVEVVPDIENSVEIKQVQEEIENFMVQNHTVDRYQAKRVEEEVYLQVAADYSPEQARDMAELVRKVNYPEETNYYPAAERRLLLENTETRGGADAAQLVTGALAGAEIHKIMRVAEASGIDMSKAAENENGKLSQFAQFMNRLKTNEGLPHLFQTGQRVVQVTDILNGGWKAQLMARLGMSGAGEAAASRLGFQTTGEFMGSAARILTGDFSFSSIKTILAGVFDGGLKTAAKGAVVSSAGGTALAAAGTIGSGGLAAIAIVGLNFLKGLTSKIGNIFGGLKNVLGGMGKSANGLGPGIKRGIGNAADGAGKGIVGLGDFFTTILGTLGVLLALPYIFIATIIIGIMVFLGIYSTNTANYASTWVTTGYGGSAVCVKITAQAGDSSKINCNQNAQVSDEELKKFGINKAKYVDLAKRWTLQPDGTVDGQTHVDECFNDVVRQSIDRGMDPVFALAIWLNESDASNYTMHNTKGQDFGINMPDVPNKDFNAQITKFLSLSHNPKCTGLADDLAWATNYLTGGCDPNKSIQGETGYKYLDDINQRIGSFTDPKKSLVIPPWLNGSGSTGNGTNNQFPYQFADDNGNQVLCTSPEGPGGGDGSGGSTIPADPIFDENCANSPAYCVVDYLVKNGAVYITNSNVDAAASLIDKWSNAPAGFDKKHFNSSMTASANAFTGFQCVGFACAVKASNCSSAWGGSHESWDGMIAHGSASCPRIDASGAGVGDMILFNYPPTNWYHVVVLSKLASDGSFSISQANWGGVGKMSNVNGSNIQDYLSGKSDGLPKSVLRCN